jgi:GTP-binding protein YchF
MQRGSGAESLDLARLREVDALAHVVRAFDDPDVLHPEGSVDPQRDVEIIDLELILADLEIVARRIERLEKNSRRGLCGEEKAELELLAKVIQPALEAERPLRELELSPGEEKRLRGFQLLSAKPLLVVLNVDEDALSRQESLLSAKADYRTRELVVVSAPIEAEISQLDPEHQAEFLAELGLAEPSLDRVIRASYRLLGLISFFTVGEDEVRAWTVRQGTPARQAGGAIHSDIERGFIRVEVMKFDDLIAAGSEQKVKQAGKMQLNGKDYVIEDGDICHFLFNV